MKWELGGVQQNEILEKNHSKNGKTVKKMLKIVNK